MRAASLRTCLNSLGANFINEIEYIETEYGNEDYLNKVCKAVDEFLVYDKLSTESQPDSCTSGRTAYMYPSHCTHGWLGPNCTNICFSDCLNSCGKANYDGFYCKGIYNIWYKNYKHIKHYLPLVNAISNLFFFHLSDPTNTSNHSSDDYFSN